MFNVNLYRIQDYVITLAKKKEIKYFYPQTISRVLDIPLDLVVDELTKLTSEGFIFLKYQIRCKTDSHILYEIEDFNELLNKNIYCEQCGSNLNVTFDEIYPTYYISNELIEYLNIKQLH